MFLYKKNGDLKFVFMQAVKADNNRFKKGLDKFMENSSMDRHYREWAGMCLVTSLIQQLWILASYERRETADNSQTVVLPIDNTCHCHSPSQHEREGLPAQACWIRMLL